MALKGNEILYVQGIAQNNMPSGEQFPTTTGAIAQLASEEGSLTNTAITTVGNGTLTAAGLVGGQITRTGPTSNFTDTVDTAADIIAALPGVVVGSTFLVRIKNATAFQQTLATALGVTLPTNVIIPNFSVGHYYVTVNSATAVTFSHMDTSTITPEANYLLASAVPIVSTVTLANVSGLSATLLTSGTYKIVADLPVTANAAGGVALAMAASNSLTATSFSLTGKFFTATGTYAVNTTTLGGGVGTTVATVLAELEGVIVVNTGGTITLQAAQNVATTATTTLLANGFLSVTRMS